MLYPLVLSPVFKDYLWGGTKLKDVYNKKSELLSIAESWELADHPEGVCSIANGPYKGVLFCDYVKKEGAETVFGRGIKKLPLLVKIIDSAKSLSIQVHPDSEYAALHENGQEGKTEFWYIMDCEPNATLYYGFSREVSRAEVKERIHNGTITDVLNRISVKKGDTFLIEPGTIHAIGKHMTIAEIGTNSNITYRVYDFKRKDAHGNLRPLHIAQAIDVLNTGCPAEYVLNGSLDFGVYKIEKLGLNRTANIQNTFGGSFHNLFCVEGTSILEYNGGVVEFAAGTDVFVPAGLGEYGLSGDAVVLKTTV